MKPLLLSLILVLWNLTAYSQIETTQSEDKRAALTVGILQGGGALVGPTSNCSLPTALVYKSVPDGWLTVPD